MAKHLTDRQKKRIVADYIDIGSYNAVAKKYGVSDNTVRKVVLSNPEIASKLEEKKEQNSADVLAHLETKKGVALKIIDRYLEALLDEDRIKKATPVQLSTVFGTIVDKYMTISDVEGASGVKIIDDFGKTK